MNNKVGELILRNLLEEKGITYKIKKSDNELKFNYLDKEYKVIIPDDLKINGEKTCCDNIKGILIRLNEDIEFNDFNKLLKRINFFEKCLTYITLNDVQTNILLPNRKKALWFESCYHELYGALLNFKYKNTTYVFALEEKTYSIETTSDKLVKDLSTEFCDKQKLARYDVLSDKDVKKIDDIDVLIYKNNKLTDKTTTEKILNYLGNILQFEEV